MNNQRHIQLVDLSQFDQKVVPSTAEASVAAFNKRLLDSDDPNKISLYDEALQEFVVNVTKKANFNEHFEKFKESAECIELFKPSMRGKTSKGRKKNKKEASKAAIDTDALLDKVQSQLYDAELSVSNKQVEIERLERELADTKARVHKLIAIEQTLISNPNLDLLELLIELTY